MYQQPHPYQQQPGPHSSPLGYTSPPMGPTLVQDPYRASPIPMQARSPYTSALSPPSSSSGFAPMPAPSSSRHGAPQYASRSGGARYPASPQGYGGQPNYGALPVPPQQTPQQPKFKGTLAPGTIIKVGESHVRIERYLSEGGYAHVYLTASERPIYPPSIAGAGAPKGRWGEKGYTQHCLKRIAFEDEKVWVDVRKEIEVMKALPPNPHLTQYLASAHSRLPNGGYEVFILMEFCSGGGIIDLLNKRLRDRLKEIEILNIFTDVCEAVAAMHHLKQPLLHRDLKIENVLSAPTGQPPSPQRPTPLIFKLCDFGSTTFPSSHPPQNKAEAEALALNLNKHTTLQYRSPEMVEPMLGWAVGLPSDVWALGVLLYKLCYYTTPFEEHGTLAIVNAKYTFPQYPVYSPKIQHLIASMLVDHPARRPSVFEILNVAHEMSGTRPEIDYPLPSHSFPPPHQQSSKPKSNSVNLLDFTSPSPTASSAPPVQPDLATTVQPQRRGRPTRDPSNRPMSTLPPPSAQALPPMPVPPSIPAEQPAPKPKMQVTGEQPKRQTDQGGLGAAKQEQAQAEKQPSTDAFGMPAVGATTKSISNGFGDSFASQPKGVAGISQRFGGGAPARSGTAASGFSDSFTSPRPTPQSTTRPGFRVASPESTLAATKPAPKANDGGADLSFETRFPSIDTLDSDDAFSPQPTKSVSNLISPITSPPVKPSVEPRASMMGHLTGDMAPKHQPLAVRAEGGPQPRSTQVTGTAFKEKGGVSPAAGSSRGAKGDYFALVEDKVEAAGTGGQAKATEPVDLMTGDAYSSMTATSRQNSLLSNGNGAVRPVATSSRSRSDLPTITAYADKASSSSDEDTSDEEDVRPESASGSQFRPSEPLSRQAEFPSRSSMAFSPSSSSAPKEPSSSRPGPGLTAPKPQLSNLRQNSTERARPQSMFIPSSSFQPLLSPSSGASPAGTSAGGAGRPSHIRKGSITDMVTKYESLQTPSASESPDRRGSGSRERGAMPSPTKEKASNGLGRKPSVASKPAALRKPTVDIATAAPRSSSPEKKPATTSTISSTTPSNPSPGTVADKPKPKPNVTEKPTLASKPSRHGDMPSVAGWSKSSSGRSFPISRAVPSASSAPPPRTTTPLKEAQNEVAAAKGPGQSAGSGSRSGSPEKQQSVGSLIARWNQNQTK